MRDYQKYAIVLAVFAAVLYLALIVAAFGLISLATDEDVVSAADAGPLLGPAMIGTAVVLVFLHLVRLGVTRRPERQRVAVGYAGLAALYAWGIFVLAGSLLYGLGANHTVALSTFVFTLLRSPFALAAGALAFIVTLAYSLILATRMREHGRPLWPWEK